MGSTSLVSFAFDATDVRVTSRDGEPWFVLADVCRVLGISNPSDAASRLKARERHTLGNTEGIADSRVQSLVVISESGLYKLVLRSRKPEAERFADWITEDVIPSIRKTGGYGAPQVDVRDPAQLANIAIQLIEVNKEQQAQIEEMRPQVQALERIALSDGSMCPTDAAKTLQIRRKDLLDYLQARRWAYRRPGGSGWIAYQDKLASGLLEHKVTTFTGPDGYEKSSTQLRVTSKGLTRLAKELSPGVRVA